ncbi:MAG: bifunctional transaldolase/phosoglucose isomerase [Calditrichia bacterium]
MNALLKLIDYGQSYWLDNLTRGKIRSGEIKKRVTEEGLRGITSNPAIFNKAISKSSDYDEQIKRLVEEGQSVHKIYEALVVKDVQDACDILRPVYDESGGVDGFVSLEVSPYLAHDTEGTMEEARRLFAAVNRPNCFIKIPGTKEGVPAIEQMLYEGVNINITLLFAIENYEAVAKAYILALERRVAENKPIDKIASVASFFLSRIDVLTDQLLGHLIIPGKTDGSEPRPEQLLGKAAIASAKLAYQSFKKIFSGERWQALVERGAKVQRPLWASTSTKDPLYRDVRYVESIIGPNTVNTLPDETIAAFADHGKIYENSVETDIEGARQTVRDLKKAGVDIDFVTTQLINEGVQKFIDPYDKLMETLADERNKFLTHKTGSQTLSFGETEGEVKKAYSSLDEKQYARRLFDKDPYLWKSEPEHVKSIRNRLGWLNSVDDFLAKTEELTSFAQEIKEMKFQHVVLLGMGGSSLCPEVSRETFGSTDGYPRLIVLDNTDPAAIRNVESQIDLMRTLFIVASKSGTTTETLSFYRYFYQNVKKQTGDKVGNHFVAITDPGTPLVEEAKQKKFRRIFENPKDLGGRYSALSYFGLVPMALIGMDVKTLLSNARQIKMSCGPFIPSEVNPGVALGGLLGMNRRLGRDKVTFILSKSVHAFGYWVEQLIAESTGKEGVGLVPVESEYIGVPENYSPDRVFVYIYTNEDDNEETEEQIKAVEKAGHPIVRIEIRDRLALGAQYFHWEMATATAGKIIGVNPFDEPNVSESKKNTRDLLEEWKKNGRFDEGKAIIEEDGLAVYCDTSAKWLFKEHRNSLGDFLKTYVNLANSPDYIALLAYFMRTDTRHDILQDIRLQLRDRRKVATTLGYGPRYLHSTGQLHKGGPNWGVYLVFSADAPEEIPIPEEKFGFATLQRSQVLGDLRSLEDKERRVIRIHLGKDIEGGLKKIAEKLK